MKNNRVSSMPLLLPPICAHSRAPSQIHQKYCPRKASKLRLYPSNLVKIILATSVRVTSLNLWTRMGFLRPLHLLRHFKKCAFRAHRPLNLRPHQLHSHRARHRSLWHPDFLLHRQPKFPRRKLPRLHRAHRNQFQCASPLFHQRSRHQRIPICGQHHPRTFDRLLGISALVLRRNR